MKRTLTTIMLFSILIIMTFGTVMAGNPDYSIIEYTGGVVAATVDGEWTTEDEWNDALLVPVSDDFAFLYNVDLNTYSCEFCVELFTDDTDDAEDYWQFCFDDSNGGGTAPQAGDFRVDIVGHTTLTVYEGNGQGWDEIASGGEITWADSISDSPLNSTPHWILEFTFIKTGGNMMIGNAPPTGLRVAAYDASNSEAGVQAWAPDSSVDVPDEWGLISTYSSDSIPEGLTFAVMGVLSSVSLLVGSRYLQKRIKKHEN
ncbi:MAG: hypothetical protein NWF03_05730 [Candidatus Bathyarchaeota archaeon]|nr:hypothetical protein [Candidatus Bathyarchaeota archaeon]